MHETSALFFTSSQNQSSREALSEVSLIPLCVPLIFTVLRLSSNLCDICKLLELHALFQSQSYGCDYIFLDDSIAWP